METIQLWARHGDAVRQAIELGELVHLDTAREELTDEFLLFAIQSGLLSKWAEAFPDPRQEPEINMEVMVASHLAARFAGLYAIRKSGYVLRSASVLGALGSSVEVLEPAQGLSLRGTSDDKLLSGDVLRKLLVKLEKQVDPNEPLCVPPSEPSLAVKVRPRAARRAVKGAGDVAEAEDAGAVGRRKAAGVVQRQSRAIAVGVCPGGQRSTHPYCRHPAWRGAPGDRDLRVQWGGEKRLVVADSVDGLKWG